MSGVKLYERTEALAIVRGMLDESDGELTPEIADLLTLAEGEFAEKVERVALFIRELEAHELTIDQEADRLAARMRGLRKSADGLKRYLQTQMENAGKDKIKGVLVTVAIQQNNPAVTVHATADIFLWPETFVRHVPATWEADKKALLVAAKAGEALPPGVEVTRSSSLRLR